MENKIKRKPQRIRRKSDGEIFELQPEGNYANLELKDQSIMRWLLGHFDPKHFEFIYD